MRLTAKVFLAGSMFLSGCTTYSAAVKGDVPALQAQPIVAWEECRLCLSGVRSSALGCAAAAGQVEAVRALLAMGAKPDNCHGSPWGAGAFSPLGMAAQRRRPGLVRMLLDAGADPSYNDGMACPLHYAGDDKEIVTMLLAAGADPDCRSPLSQMTPLEEAEKYGRPSVLRLLRKAHKAQEAQSEPAAKAGSPEPEAPPRPSPAAAAWSEVDSPKYRLAQRPDDFAVVVGVEKYANDLPEARFADRDAAAMKAHLLAGGIPERNIKMLVGPRATKGQIEAYVEDWLPRMAKPDGRVFFYFSGHGAPDPGTSRAFLVPFDGDPSFLSRTAYPLQRLYSSLGSLKAASVIVALDSCFSGAGGRSLLSQGSRPLVTKVDVGLSPGGKLSLFAAASASETTATLDQEGHGAFTYYFLQGLGGEAKDASGRVTGSGLYTFLKPKVQDAAARQNRDQTPLFEGQDAELARFE